LERCLQAVEPQLTFYDELIVVDNGSIDASADIARRYGATVISETRPGIAAASAAGYDFATGDIIGRLDADSLPGEDWVETVMAHFAEDEQSVAVTGGATFTDGPRILRALGAAVYLGPYFLTVALALGHVPLFGSNCAFRRTEWVRVRNEVHRSDVMVHDDMDLSFHLGPSRRITYSRQLKVGISGRPFSDGAGILRARRAFHTIFIHWPHHLPWLRMARRAAGSARTRSRVLAP
jgi:glycosyltransferase involved in cell wall biosynthesis